MYQDENDPNAPRGTFETYKAEGDMLYIHGKFSKAIESYTTALELRPDDKECLVARSKCNLQLGDTAQALKDAEESLKEDKCFHKGLFQKAEALYQKGDFELALVFYHRGRKLRPELEEFRLGIQKATEAIDNCVGSPHKCRLTKEGDLSFFQIDECSRKGKLKPAMPAPGRKVQQKVVTKRYTTVNRSAKSEKTVKQLLGELYCDKIYLEKLLRETDVKTNSEETISDLVSEGLKYLDTRSEFWRQQKPIYARKRERYEQRMNMKGVRSSPAAVMIRELQKILQAERKGNFKESLRRAKQCYDSACKLDDGLFKWETLSDLNSSMGLSLMETEEFEEAKEHFIEELRIAESKNLLEIKCRALENLGMVHIKTKDFKTALKHWQKRLPMSATAVERAWLSHEIGRCYLELNKYEEAKKYANKSSDAAKDAKDWIWKLNARVLLAQSEVKLGDIEGALTSFRKASRLAEKLYDERASSAINLAMAELEAARDESNPNIQVTIES